MFAKVFEQILDSSIATDWQVRHVFEDLLKLAKKDGNHWIVDMTSQSISRRTGVPLDVVTRSLKKLEQPDPDSRSPEEQGRRIVRLDSHRAWGWRIVNYQKYREIATREMVRMSDADRKRSYRNRFTPSPPTPPVPSQSTEAEAEQSGFVPDMSRTVLIPKSLNTPTFVSVWSEWIGVRKKKKACKDWHTLFTKQLEWLQGFAVPVAVEIINNSIRNDWQGLFPPKEANATHQGNNPKRFDRNKGTYNEGKGHLYAEHNARLTEKRLKETQLGLDSLPDVQRSTTGTDAQGSNPVPK